MNGEEGYVSASKVHVAWGISKPDSLYCLRSASINRIR